MEINGLKMVTDRSASDVEIAKTLVKKDFKTMSESEKQIFLSGLKGAYNYVDFNRVEKAVEYLSGRLYDVPADIRKYSEKLGVAWDSSFDVGYEPEAFEKIETKTDWAFSDILNSKDRERYIANINNVVSSFSNIDNLPKSLERMSYIGANKIEKSLCETDVSLTEFQEEKNAMIYNASKSWYFNGELYGGEV